MLLLHTNPATSIIRVGIIPKIEALPEKESMSLLPVAKVNGLHEGRVKGTFLVVVAPSLFFKRIEFESFIKAFFQLLK